jgi:hypothetical protein
MGGKVNQRLDKTFSSIKREIFFCRRNVGNTENCGMFSLLAITWQAQAGQEWCLYLLSEQGVGIARLLRK